MWKFEDISDQCFFVAMVAMINPRLVGFLSQIQSCAESKLETDLWAWCRIKGDNHDHNAMSRGKRFTYALQGRISWGIFRGPVSYC
jgi:hypothetical protein